MTTCSCEGCKTTFFSFIVLTEDLHSLIGFLQVHGIFPTSVVCPNCQKNCRLCLSDCFRFRCSKKFFKAPSSKKKKKWIDCGYTLTVKKGTFLANSKLPMEVLCRFLALWLLVSQPRHEMFQHEFQMSAATVVYWSNFCVQVCMVCLIDSSEKLGGEGKTVEIDEGKLGKRQYNKGNRIDGSWVFAGFERGSKKTFFLPVENPTKETLLDTVKQWILPQTTIVSHCWTTYDCLTDERFVQESTENGYKFLIPEKGIATKFVKKTGPCEGYFAEQQFFKKFPVFEDRLHNFFKGTPQVYVPVVTEDANEETREALEQI